MFCAFSASPTTSCGILRCPTTCETSACPSGSSSTMRLGCVMMVTPSSVSDCQIFAELRDVEQQDQQLVHERVCRQRFGQVIMKPCSDRALTITLHRMGREGDDWNILHVDRGFQGIQEFPA